MENIEAGNRIIAEFDGNTNDRVFYHDSYDWLMPVWVKFRELVVLKKDRHDQTRHMGIIGNAMVWHGLPELFSALVEAVRWWNEVKKGGNGE
jgi:hypothetical protein